MILKTDLRTTNCIHNSYYNYILGVHNAIFLSNSFSIYRQSFFFFFSLTSSYDLRPERKLISPFLKVILRKQTLQISFVVRHRWYITNLKSTCCFSLPYLWSSGKTTDIQLHLHNESLCIWNSLFLLNYDMHMMHRKIISNCSNLTTNKHQLCVLNANKFWGFSMKQ